MNKYAAQVNVRERARCKRSQPSVELTTFTLRDTNVSYSHSLLAYIDVDTSYSTASASLVFAISFTCLRSGNSTIDLSVTRYLVLYSRLCPAA